MNTVNSDFRNPTRLPVLFCLFVALFAVLPGCATVGRDFPVTAVSSIEIGKTTQREILSIFGAPWRTGIEDGQTVWTYGSYHYALFSEKKARDLVIRFDNRDVVASYTFSTTDNF